MPSLCFGSEGLIFSIVWPSTSYLEACVRVCAQIREAVRFLQGGGGAGEGAGKGEGEEEEEEEEEKEGEGEGERGEGEGCSTFRRERGDERVED